MDTVVSLCYVINFNMVRPGPRDPRNVSKTVVKQSSTAEFQLLHLSVLREYIDMDICLGLRQDQATHLNRLTV